ncbi:hypothetical protein PINS_up019170 [Pythium insidiosum]|nr:hypothetical protein PINS_up019170 [Pythium insidiosum]
MSISVGPAGKVGEGVNAYFVYKVTSDMFSLEPMQVDRRYSDFLWLHTQLSRQCAGFIIPPLPAKVVPLLQGPEFLERRRSGLERFLRKVVEHDELKNTNYFKSFLECSPVELTAIKAESQRVSLTGSRRLVVVVHIGVRKSSTPPSRRLERVCHSSCADGAKEPAAQ